MRINLPSKLILLVAAVSIVVLLCGCAQKSNDVVRAEEIPAVSVHSVTPTTPAYKNSPVRVEPNFGVAGDFGTWIVTYTVGAAGMRQGGGVRVQLPDAWHSGERNSANRLQATDPTADHYVTARCSRPDVRLKTEVESESNDYLVKSSRQGLDGRLERYVFVVRVTVSQGRLAEGDTVEIIYGDTSGGSRGMKASIISTGPQPILMAVDRDGFGRFELLADQPTLTAKSGTAAELVITGPSTLVIGEPAELHVAVVDRFANPVTLAVKYASC